MPGSISVQTALLRKMPNVSAMNSSDGGTISTRRSPGAIPRPDETPCETSGLLIKLLKRQLRIVNLSSGIPAFRTHNSLLIGCKASRHREAIGDIELFGHS